MKKCTKAIAIGVVCSLFMFTVSLAATTVEKVTVPSDTAYTWVTVKEWVRANLLTFKTDSKIELFDDYCDQRIDEMEYASSVDDFDATTSSLERFEIQKRKALELAKNANDEAVMERVRTRALEQQRIMTKLQLQLNNDEELQGNVVRVQKQFANQVVDTVQTVEGQVQADIVDQQTWVVWSDPEADVNGNLPVLPDKLEYAPGTSAGGVGGRVYEGGSGNVWAPGTSAGSSSTNQTYGNVVEESSGSNSNGQSSGNVVESGNGAGSQGTSSGSESSGNVVNGN